MDAFSSFRSQNFLVPPTMSSCCSLPFLPAYSVTSVGHAHFGSQQHLQAVTYSFESQNALCLSSQCFPKVVQLSEGLHWGAGQDFFVTVAMAHSMTHSGTSFERRRPHPTLAEGASELRFLVTVVCRLFNSRLSAFQLSQPGLLGNLSSPSVGSFPFIPSGYITTAL